MKSVIAEAARLKYTPVALQLTDAKPEGAKQFKPKKWGCVMFLLAAAARGERAVFDRETFGCFGGGVGLGFGNQYKNFPGGEDCFFYFLSVGNDQWERGRQTAEHVKPFLRPEAFDNFTKGERYVKTPELTRQFVENLPMRDIPFEYVVFTPLDQIDPDRDKPEVIIFLGDMDQVSALTVLANYGREDNENVIFPYAAGCMSVGIYPLKEAESEKPRAVLGMNDLSARLAIKRLLKADVMTFAAPWRLFLEMEENVPGSFFERHTWNELMALKNKP